MISKNDSPNIYYQKQKVKNTQMKWATDIIKEEKEGN